MAGQAHSDVVQHAKSDSQPEDERAWLDRRAVILVGLCSIVYLLDGLIPAMLGPIAPSISDELSLSPAQLGPIFSADLIGQSIGLFFVPLLGRWLHHRDVLWLSLAGFGVCHALSGLADGPQALFALRLLTGFFVGGALPAGLALVAGGVVPTRRGTALMLVFTAYGLGKMIAGLIVGVVGGEAWRLILATSGVVCILVAVPVWKALSHRDHDEATRAADAATTGAPASQLLSRSMLGGTGLLWVMFICSLTINYCLASWLPTMLVESGRDQQIASFAYSIFAIGGILATFSYGPLIDRVGSFTAIATSYAAGASLLLIIGLNFDVLKDGPLLALLAATGFFILGSFGGINVVLADFYPADLRAIGAGWAKGVGRIGTTIAPIVIGLALSAGVAERQIMSIFAIPALICLVAILLVSRLSARRTQAREA